MTSIRKARLGVERQAAGSQALANSRVRYWGKLYLRSTAESASGAEQSFQQCDFFTAYLYLFVAFNNLYSFLAHRTRGERAINGQPARIRAAVKLIPSEQIDRFYTGDFHTLIVNLNEGYPEQFTRGPDAGSTSRGVLKMKDYFSGNPPEVCVAHVDIVAVPKASAVKKRTTLQEVAAHLLYAVRNNQFHAVKSAQHPPDLDTLRTAYLVLQPIVSALTPIARSRLDST